MKKKINVDLIQNELAGSVFFPTTKEESKPNELPDEDDFKNYSPTPQPLPSQEKENKSNPPLLPPISKAIPPPVKPAIFGKDVTQKAIKKPQLASEKSQNPYARTDGRRYITRTPFEFYQDQLEWLRNASIEDRANGGNGSMSKMVREALDEYIAKKSKK